MERTNRLWILIGVVSFFVSGCIGTPKVSQWITPKNFTIDQVFDAALTAATENNFTIVSSDRTSGVISIKRHYSGEGGGYDRRMGVRIKQKGDKIVVSTKISSSDFSLGEGCLGGMIHEDLTRNFYFYLFRELNISKASSRNVVIEDAH